MTSAPHAHPSLENPGGLQRFIKENKDYMPPSPKRQKTAEPTTSPTNDEQREIYIGNIDFAGASMRGLCALVEEYGTIQKMRILYEGHCKIYAFVLFSERSSALLAVQCLQDKLYRGRKLCACISLDQ